MKKRYARILAATLSAAMVFTSAPASVFDTGVIEAKAAADKLAVPSLSEVKRVINVAYNGGNDQYSDYVSNPSIANVTLQTEETIEGPAAGGGSATVDIVASIAAAKVLDSAGFADGSGYCFLDEDLEAEGWSNDTYTGDVTVTSGDYWKVIPQTVNVYASTTAAELGDMLAEALTNKEVAYDGTSSLTSYVNAAIADVEDIVKCPIDNHTVTITPTFTDEDPAEPGEYDVVYKAACATCSADTDAASPKKNLTTKLIVKKAAVSNDEVKINGTVYCKYGTTTLMVDVDGNPTTLVGATDYDFKSASERDKVAGKAVDTTVTGVVVRKAADPNKDYTGVSAYKDGYLEQTISVKIVKATTATGTADLATAEIPASVECTWGGTDIDVKKANGTDSSEYWEVLNPSELAKYNCSDDVKVRVRSLSHTDSNVDWAGMEDTLSIKYSSKGYFYKDVPLTVNQKTLNSDKIVWPTSLAAGVTVNKDDDVTELELAETESNKYGSFKILGYGADLSAQTTSAALGYQKYNIEFKPNDNCEVGDIATKDAGKVLDHNADNNVTNGNFVKVNAIGINVDRTVVKASDIAIKAKSYVDPDAYEYGTTVGDLVNDFNWSDKVDYEVQDISPADLLPIGTTTLKYKATLKDDENYQFEDGKNTAEVTLKVSVVAPKVKSEVSDGFGTSGTYDKNAAVTLYAGLKGYKSDGEKISGALDDLLNLADVIDYSYQWYLTEDGKTSAIRGATEFRYDPVLTVYGTAKYYCDITAKVKDTATDAQKAVLAKVLDSKYKTSEYTLTVSRVAVDVEAPAGLKYGYLKTSMEASVETAGWKIQSAKWSYTKKDTDKKVTIAENEINSSKTITAIDFPTGLEAGTYNFEIEIVTEKDGTKDTHIAYVPVVIDKAVLDEDDWKEVTIDKTTVKYGTKMADIKITGKKDSDKLGTFEWENPDDVLFAGDYADGGSNQLEDADTNPVATVLFIPNDTVKNNYYNDEAGTKFTDTVAAEIEKAEVTIEKATLKIKPADITVAVGETVDAKAIKDATEGLVGFDTIGNLGVKVSYKLADKIDTTKAGTVADAIVTSVKVRVDDSYEDVKNTNRKVLLDNYEIEVANGSVIVKAATVAPSVKPTPAPVKQATAAAPKAAKAKATVKVGKKYTLKLKYAAGKKATVKKVTWKSSKKSVATVSSKGKVTAKKAGKATIAATITFKDGSKKKVKFTVTVK